MKERDKMKRLFIVSLMFLSGLFAQQTSLLQKSSQMGENASFRAYSFEKKSLSPTDWVIDENFDDGTSLPAGWTRIDGEGDGYMWGSYSYDPHSAPYSFGCRYHSTGNDDWLITPQVLVESGYMLDFWYASQDPSWLCDLEVALSTGGATAPEFTNILMSETSIPTTWQHAEISLAAFVGMNVYIGFHNISTDEFIIKVDDVKVGIIPDHDIAITTDDDIVPVVPPTSYTPQIDVMNNGANTETFNVSCDITHGTSTVYSETVSVASLSPAASRTVTFPTTSVFDGNKVYSASYNAMVAGDAKLSDNTLTKTITAYNTTYRKVFFQEFTSVYCGYCPRAAEGLDSVSTVLGDSIIIAAYHTTLSFGSDPFYLSEAVPFVSAYGITGYPTVVCNGLDRVSGGYPGPDYGYTQYMGLYNDAKDDYVPFTIDVYVHNVTGTGCDIVTTVHQVAELQTGITVKLRYTVIENDIPYSWGTSPPQDYVQECARTLLVGSDGILLSDTLTIDERHLTFDGSWEPTNVYIIAYVQNDNTGEIYTAKEASAVALDINENMTPTPSILEITPYPNPFNSSCVISGVPEGAGVEIYDLRGRLVYKMPVRATQQITQGLSSATHHKIIWTPDETIDSGIYFICAKNNDTMTAKKIIYLK